MSVSKKKIISGHHIIINDKGQFFIKRRVGFRLIATYYFCYKP